jgi:hypothetical protein
VNMGHSKAGLFRDWNGYFRGDLQWCFSISVGIN